MTCINCGDAIEETESGWRHVANGSPLCRMMYSRGPGNVVYEAFPGGDGLTVGIRNAIDEHGLDADSMLPLMVEMYERTIKDAQGPFRNGNKRPGRMIPELRHENAWRIPTDDAGEYGVLVMCGAPRHPYFWLLCPTTATLYLGPDFDLRDCHDGAGCDYLEGVHEKANALVAQLLPQN